MLQARMATRVAKPNGQFWLRPDDVASFMLDKKATDLPGQMEQIFSAHCVQLYADLHCWFGVTMKVGLKGPRSISSGVR